jgi:hypothetical protein
MAPALPSADGNPAHSQFVWPLPHCQIAKLRQLPPFGVERSVWLFDTLYVRAIRGREPGRGPFGGSPTGCSRFSVAASHCACISRPYASTRVARAEASRKVRPEATWQCEAGPCRRSQRAETARDLVSALPNGRSTNGRDPLDAPALNRARSAGMNFARRVRAGVHLPRPARRAEGGAHVAWHERTD